MWNVPTKNQLSRLPKLYETENLPLKDKLIHIHFFMGGCDWYIAEYDGEDLFWGFADLGDPQNAEWGYMSFQEMRDIEINRFEIDCEIFDPPKKAGDIKKIRT
jgi:hypothetical protein